MTFFGSAMFRYSVPVVSGVNLKCESQRISLSDFLRLIEVAAIVGATVFAGFQMGSESRASSSF